MEIEKTRNRRRKKVDPMLQQALDQIEKTRNQRRKKVDPILQQALERWAFFGGFLTRIFDPKARRWRYRVADSMRWGKGSILLPYVDEKPGQCRWFRLRDRKTVQAWIELANLYGLWPSPANTLSLPPLSRSRYGRQQLPSSKKVQKNITKPGVIFWCDKRSEKK